MFQIPELTNFQSLFHTFSTVDDGNMANSISGNPVDFERVLSNRKKFFIKTNVPADKTIGMWVQGEDGFQDAQVKAAGISVLDRDKAIRTDGLITNKKGTYLFMLTADCAPIIIFDPKKQVLALVHTGWKGADLGIVKKVVKRIEKVHKCYPGNLIIGIGPSARKESYLQKYPSQINNKKWIPFLNKIKPDVFGIDVVGLIKKQFLDIGVLKEHIYDSNIDTITDKRFYSHYRDKNKSLEKQGRFACIAGIA